MREKQRSFKTENPRNPKQLRREFEWDGRVFVRRFGGDLGCFSGAVGGLVPTITLKGAPDKSFL